MPKFGVNSKKEEAREKEKAKKTEKKAKEEKEKEDAKWIETDAHALKKQKKQAEEEQKQAERLKREAEKKALWEAEQEELSKIKKDKHAILEAKGTRKQGLDAYAVIEEQLQEKYKPAEKKQETKQKRDDGDDGDLEAQLNREFEHMYKNQKSEWERAEDEVVADDLDTALEGVGDKSGKQDLHPERRIKKAWIVYQEQHMADARKQYPGFNRHKLMQVLWEQFKESPEHPMNSNKNADWVDGKPVKKE